MSQCEQQPNEDRLRTLTEIYAEHDGFIQSIIRYAAKNQADQEDIYQEVFLVLYQKADLGLVQDFKGYLYRLVINKANEFLRRKIRQELKLEKFMDEQSPDAVEAGPDAAAEELLVLDEVEGMIELIRAHLPGRESEAILLRFRDHYDNEEAAKKMNVRKETLVHYVSVGLKKLRKILNDKGKS